MTSNARSTRHSSLKRVLVPEAADAVDGGWVALDKSKMKHLMSVLRMRWGEPLELTNGAGALYEARLEESEGCGGVRLLALKKKVEPVPSFELLICLPKNSVMDALVEKAVECGVSAICPIVSSRSVVRPDGRDLEKYVKRWQTIADGAVEQSERLWRSQVDGPRAWNLAIRPKNSGADFVFVSELRGEPGLKSTWETLVRRAGGPIRIMIGPEGGFTASEREELRGARFTEVSLGESVLRVETAVVAACTLVEVTRAIK